MAIERDDTIASDERTAFREQLEATAASFHDADGHAGSYRGEPNTTFRDGCMNPTCVKNKRVLDGFIYPDFIVTALAAIRIRVENLPEGDAKPYFDDMAERQGLARKLYDAVEDTDFVIDFDLSDTEVEQD